LQAGLEMKKLLLVMGLAAIVGCGKSGPASEAARERTRPVSKDKPGVEFPGEYPSGTNL
jgi:predicted small lipoprotein YifL